MKRDPFRLVLLFIASALLAPSLEAATSISQYGITWIFDKDHPTGQFINGDYWVLGPVTIMQVAPAWDGSCNGTMVDPVPATAQGYRQTWPMGAKFDDSLRAQFPLKLDGVHSVVSTIGLAEPKKGGAYEGLDTAAVLTVVDKAPPADAFRPPYVAGDKPIYTASQLQWDRLPLLPKPATVPNAGDCLKRVWLDQLALKGNSVATVHPRSNMAPYYFFDDSSIVALLVMIDTPERKELTYRLVQYGIDLYAISQKNEDAWRGYGGFGNGRKWPILFAGIMLNDEKMLSPPKFAKSSNSRTGTVDKFGEDGHTWYGQPTQDYPQGKPLWGNDAPNQEVVFKRFMELGELHASGDKDIRDPAGLRDGPSFGYREICSVSWVGPALAARLMGAMDIWGHPAFFDYEDRWIKEESAKPQTSASIPHVWGCGTGGTSGSPGIDGGDFMKVMWETYRPKANDVKQLPAPKTGA